MFWFLFSGLFLFRFADRRFSALLLKEPPRSTGHEDQRSLDLTRRLYVMACQRRRVPRH